MTTTVKKEEWLDKLEKRITCEIELNSQLNPVILNYHFYIGLPNDTVIKINGIEINYINCHFSKNATGMVRYEHLTVWRKDRVAAGNDAPQGVRSKVYKAMEDWYPTVTEAEYQAAYMDAFVNLVESLNKKKTELFLEVTKLTEKTNKLTQLLRQSGYNGPIRVN